MIVEISHDKQNPLSSCVLFVVPEAGRREDGHLLGRDKL